MRRTRSTIALSIPACLALCVLLAAGCNRAAPSASAPAATNAKGASSGEALPAVEVTHQPWPQTVRVQGTLIEDEYALLGAKVAGRVKEMLVDLGTPVSQGSRSRNSTPRNST